MNNTDPVAQHAKEVVAMRYFLLGRNYHTAAAALEFAADLHDGMRKDGRHPEFSHQIFQANYLRTLESGLLFPEETLASTFLHDTCEDCGVGVEEIAARFGDRVATATRRLSKKLRGRTIPYETYFAEIAKDPVASLVKGVDRGHNIFTMAGAGWGLEKQEKYLDEVSRWFLPMLKEARRAFPQQEAAYENIKALLKVQMAHIGLNLEHARAVAEAPSGPRP
jgi:(p)ppGpp synthase/HD superfamily hydrolase